MLAFISLLFCLLITAYGIEDSKIFDLESGKINLIDKYPQCTDLELCLAESRNDITNKPKNYEQCGCVFIVSPSIGKSISIEGSDDGNISILKTNNLNYEFKFVGFANIDVKQSARIKSECKAKQSISFNSDISSISLSVRGIISFTLIPHSNLNKATLSVDTVTEANVISLTMPALNGRVTEIKNINYEIKISGAGNLLFDEYFIGKYWPREVTVGETDLSFMNLGRKVTINYNKANSSNKLELQNTDALITGQAKTDNNLLYISASTSFVNDPQIPFSKVEFKNAPLARTVVFQGGCIFADLSSIFTATEGLNLNIGSENNMTDYKQNFNIMRQFNNEELLRCSVYTLIKIPTDDDSTSRIGTIKSFGYANLVVDGYSTGEVSINNIEGTVDTVFAFPADVYDTPTKVAIPSFTGYLGFTICGIVKLIIACNVNNKPAIFYNYIDSQPFVYMDLTPYNLSVYMLEVDGKLEIQNNKKDFSNGEIIDKNIVVMPTTLLINEIQASELIAVNANNCNLSVLEFNVGYATIDGLAEFKILRTDPSVKKILAFLILNVYTVRISSQNFDNCSFGNINNLDISYMEASNVSFSNIKQGQIGELTTVHFASFFEGIYANSLLNIQALNLDNLREFNCQNVNFVTTKESGDSQFYLATHMLPQYIKIGSFRKGCNVLTLDDSYVQQEVFFTYNSLEPKWRAVTSLGAQGFVGKIQQAPIKYTPAYNKTSITFTSGPSKITDIEFSVPGSILSKEGFDIDFDINIKKATEFEISYLPFPSFDITKMFTADYSNYITLKASKVYSTYKCEKETDTKFFFLPNILKITDKNPHSGTKSLDLNMSNCIITLGMNTSVKSDGPRKVVTERNYACSGNGTSAGVCYNGQLNPSKNTTNEVSEPGESIGESIGGLAGGNVSIIANYFSMPKNSYLDVSGEGPVEVFGDEKPGSGAAGNIYIKSAYYLINKDVRIYVAGGSYENMSCGGGGSIKVERTETKDKLGSYFVYDLIYSTCSCKNYEYFIESLVDIADNSFCPEGTHSINFSTCVNDPFDISGFIAGIVILAVVILIIIIYISVRACLVKKYHVKFCGCSIPKVKILNYTEAPNLEEAPINYNSNPQA